MSSIDFWGWVGSIAAVAFMLFVMVGPDLLSSFSSKRSSRQPEPEFKRTLPQLPKWEE